MTTMMTVTQKEIKKVDGEVEDSASHADSSDVRINLIFTIVKIKCSFSVYVLCMQRSYALVAYTYTVCV